jgi:hypothetical protein
VSPDGRWALFTSNWEKTLGIDPGGEPALQARQDAFLIELAQSDPAPPPDPVSIVTTSLPTGHRRRPYSALLVSANAQSPETWRVISGALPPGYTLDPAIGRISGIAYSAGVWTFTVTVTDGHTSASKILSIRVR